MTLKVRAYQRGKLRVPEVRLCYGPTAEAVTQSGAFADLYATPWALALEPSGVLHLLRLDAGAWLEVPSLEPLPLLPDAARHVALAWDGSARPVIAWELEGLVFIRRFDSFTGAYLVSSVPGVDPCLWSDALALETTADSDVILFHLDPARTRVFSRLQRENYSVPRASSGVFSLPADLDAAITEGHGLRLVLASSAGAFALQSPPYPVRVADAMAGRSGALTGALRFTTFEHAAADLALGEVSALGAALLPVTTLHASTDTALGEVSALDAALLLVTASHASSDDVSGHAGIGGGLLVVVTSNLVDLDALAGGAGVQEGRFE